MFYVTVIFLLLFVIALKASVIMVPQGSTFVIERMGKFQKCAVPGMHLLVPFVDRVAARVSLSDTVLDLPPFEATSADNVPLKCEGTLRYKVLNAEKAVYAVAKYRDSLMLLAQQRAQGVYSRTEFEKLLVERSIADNEIVRQTKQAAAAWGIEVLGFQTRSVTPPQALVDALQARAQKEREARQS